MKTQLSKIAIFTILIIFLGGIGLSIWLMDLSLAGITVVVTVLTTVLLMLQLKILEELHFTKDQQRELRKVLNDVAGSVGRAAPLIRGMAGAPQAGAAIPLELQGNSKDPSDDLVKAITQVIDKVDSCEKLETQVLHQIVGETRLMRIHLESLQIDSADD